MGIRNIELNCDIPNCRAMCRVERPDVEQARELAAERWGWSTTPADDDLCGPCTRGDTPDSITRGEGPPEPDDDTAADQADWLHDWKADQ